MNRSDCNLLTVDEAQDLAGRAAIALADVLAERPERLEQLLIGKGRLGGLPLEARVVARDWRSAVAQVRAVGLDWVLEQQIEGALSYVGVKIPSGLRRVA